MNVPTDQDETSSKTDLERFGDTPRSVLDNLIEGCQVINSEFRYLYVNEAVARHGRTTRDQLLGRAMMEVYPGIEDTEMFAVLRRCMDARSADVMENEFTFPDGSAGWFELRFEPVPEGVAILSVDITDRKRSEAALRRTTRALATLSDCNQTLVRATDEHQFVQAVCRIVVERGQYRAACAGWADREGTEQSHTIAHGMGGDGCSEVAAMFWTDVQSRMRSRQDIAVDDLSTVVQLADDEAPDAGWRTAAREHGCACCLMLPIRDNGHILGALAIFSDEQDAFGTKERRLLEEMALDLGYGIETLRARLARQSAESALRSSEHELAAVFDHTPVILVVIDDERRVRKANRAAEIAARRPGEEMTGLRGGEALGCLYSLDDPGGCGAGPHCQDCSIRITVLSTLETGSPKHGVEATIPLQFGDQVEERGFLVSTARLTEGEEHRVLVALQDITDRRRAERERETVAEFLQLANECSATSDLVRRSVAFFREKLEFEAVGIRLQEGDDFPYYETSGFPAEFVEIERSLCRKDRDGAVVLDRDQHPALDCMCGNVIRGRVDPKKPFFTEAGSFWSNDTTRLLATTTDAERLARTRNRCNAEGYESVGLFPLRSGEACLGLLQLNDHRRGMFSPESLLLHERLAGHLAVALGKTRSDEALARSEARYRELVDNVEDVVFTMDAGGTIEYVSSAVERVFGFPPGDLVGRHFSEFVHPEDLADLDASLAHTMEGASEPHEFRVFDREGRLKHVRSTSRRRMDGDRVTGLDGVLIDFTELAEAREDLRSSAERWRGTFDAISDIVAVITTDHEIVEINTAGCQAIGKPKDEILGSKCYELVHGGQAPITACPCTIAGRTGDPARSELEQDGHTFELLAWPLLDAERRVEGYVHIVKDITDRKRTEVALRQSEQRYRSLFDHTTMGLAYCRMEYEDDQPVDWIYLEVNDAFTALTGLHDIEGKRVTVAIPGIRESDPELFEIYSGVARGGPPERFEMYVEALSHWFDVSVYCPHPDHFVAVFDVVTERKRTEAALRLFSKRLERLAQVVQDLSRARDLDSIVDTVRHAARNLAGADGATFVLRDGDQCHYVDEDAIAPLWKGRKFPMTTCISGWSMTHREPAVIEDIYSDDRIPHDAYQPTFVKSLAMMPIRAEDPIGAVGVYWAKTYRATEQDLHLLRALADSTSVALENVRVLRELKQSEARTRAIYDHLPSATFLWRHEASAFVLVDFNRAAHDATGGGIDGFVGKRSSDLIHGFPGLEDDLVQCLREHAPVRREVACELPGSEIQHKLVLTYGYVPPELVILHAEDVTEQRKTEEQLQAAQKLEAVGRLAGGVAHDFNNLLTVINTYSDFAIQQLRDGDPMRDDLVTVLDAGNRAADLTRQLLAFSRKQVLEPVVLNINGAVAGIESMLRRLLGEDIEITVDLSDDLGRVEADPGQIEQVLMNLAVNARDAMPQGGMLAIETRNVELDEEYAKEHVSVRPGRHVLLSVSDTGCGMDEQTRQQIFEPFFTTKERGRGTGLGLSMVYGIVKQSGGNIWVYSEPGRGSTFKVYLPRVDAELSDTWSQPAAHARGGSETVLVVEDGEAVRRLIVRILKAAGYRVLDAANGGEALLQCEQHGEPIDLVLTDVVMPRMSGRELVERLTEVQPDLKVLFMSGYTDNAIVHHGVLDRGTQFIGKPFTAEGLTRKVREVLDG